MSLYYTGARREGTFWQRHSLSIVLAIILVLQTWLGLWTGHQVWLADPITDNFWVWWVYEYNTSLVADTFGVILIVLLSKRLREVGSSEDKGND